MVRSRPIPVSKQMPLSRKFERPERTAREMLGSRQLLEARPARPGASSPFRSATTSLAFVSGRYYYGSLARGPA